MAEIKKHIESRLKLLATERIEQLLNRVQPGGFQTRAVVPGDLEDWQDQQETHLDISELCNWARLYFGDSMRPHFEPPDPMTIKEAERMLKAANPLMKVMLDESTDDDFKERVHNKIEEVQSALDPRKWDGDRKNCERVTWSQLNTEKPLANNQRLQALGLIGQEKPRPGGMVSKNPMDYDYLLKDGNVVCLLPVDDRKAETPLDTKTMPWRDLDVEQAAAARSLVSRALKVNPTIRDLAMHNYVVEDGKVIGLDLTTGGSMESML